MGYYVVRGGQQFGPYTEEAVRSYLGAGTLYASDNIREESSPAWTTIGQLFQAPAATPPMMQPQAFPVQAYAVPQQGVIVPPNLHWFIVLILSITWIFVFIWAIVQASFARKIDPSSNAVWAFILWIAVSIGLLVFDVQLVLGNASQSNAQLLLIASVASAISYWAGVFGIRRSMLNYYNTIEPIQLNLSGVMTFFFGIYYLQYHMSRIARWKSTGILTA
jgi:hypothetical protein